MVLNVLETQQSRYFDVRADLEKFLKAKYDSAHPGFSFQIEVTV